MTEQLQTLLSLTTVADRGPWLQEHYPQKDPAVIQWLREESYRQERDDPNKALLVAEIIAALATLWADPPTQAVALLVEANARRLLAQHDHALFLYQSAATLYRQAGLLLDAARAAVGQLDPLMYLGRYEEALALADEAIEQFRQADDALFLGRMLMNRGNIFARLSRLAPARSDYQEARTIFTQLQAGRFLAMVNANEANVLTNLDDFRQAEQLLLQARTHFEREGMTNAVAQVEQNLGYLYFSQGEYQRALVIFNRAHAVFTVQGHSVDAAYVDLDRSTIYLALNLWKEALTISRSAREVFEAAQMFWEAAQLWLNEAAALMHIEHTQEIYTALDKARQLFIQENNRFWLAITDLYTATFELRNKNFAAVNRALERARPIFYEMGWRSRMAQCDILRGEIALAAGDLHQAQAYFTQGLTTLEGADLPTITFACHYGLGRVYKLQGQFTEAIQSLEISITAIERLQTTISAEDYKIAFLNDKLQVYEELIMLCLSLDSTPAKNRAFALVEQAKARALLDVIARGPVQPVGDPGKSDLLAELTHLKQELNWYYNRLNSPEAGSEARAPDQMARFTVAITEREQALRQVFNRLHAPDLTELLSNPIQTVTVAQIQAMLPPNVLLLEFYTAQEQIVAFGLTSGDMWVVPLATTCSTISDLLGQFRFQISKFNLGLAYRARHAVALQQGVEQSLQRLYTALLQPLEEKLETEMLLVVPHGLLHYVPFHALFNGAHYLIEHKMISYAPSSTLLQQTFAQRWDGPLEPPLIIGLVDPTIPHAQTEAETIAALFANADLRVGDAATVASLMQAPKHPAFLHISTHATFRLDNPLFSALKLADGWITVDDIYTLPTVAPLVTLSACETGRIHVHAGDELMGLSRGFFSAGAQSLVLSQWTVDDNSTAQLMAYFYEHLQRGLSIQRALQLAQQQILAERKHPYFWAPFMLIGNPWITLPRPHNG